MILELRLDGLEMLMELLNLSPIGLAPHLLGVLEKPSAMLVQLVWDNYNWPIKTRFKLVFDLIRTTLR